MSTIAFAANGVRAILAFALLCASTALAAEPIRFKHRAVDPASLSPRSADQRLAIGHHVLQFARLPDSATRSDLAERGVRLLAYLPERAFWVGVSKVASVQDIERLTGALDAVWQPGAEFKISPELAAKVAADSATPISVYALFFEDVSPARITDSLSTMGLIAQEWPAPHLAHIRLYPDQLQSLAGLDATHWIEPSPPPNQSFNLTSAQRIRATPLLAPPLSLSGANLAAGIWDSGPVSAHADFAGRLTVQNGGALSAHGTHVAGTLGGSGAGDATARGLAPALQLHSYDWNDDLNEMRTATSLTLSNHSYGFVSGWSLNASNQWFDNGATGFGNYSSVTAAWDAVVYDTGLITFNAAGNDRIDGPDCPSGPRCDGPYDTIATQASAKNAITVCATTDFDGMTSFSSWGPVNDGRIKPDVCANGSSLWSTADTGGYESRSGTSMASPSAAGAASLLIEHLRNRTGVRPAPHTVKALLVHAARDLGRTGPDYEFGWGLLDASASVALVEQQRFLVDQLSTTRPTSLTLPITVAAGAPTLKVTVAWTDPPGSPAAATALVNNLELSLIAPDNSVHLPWRLNPAVPTAAATRAVNTLDNVEQVVVDNPISGAWTVRLTGSLATGSQEYALVADALETAAISEGGAQNGVLPLAASNTAWRYYSVDLPPGTTSAVLSLNRLSHDADLYVRRGQKPTLTLHQCQSTQGGTLEEQCLLSTATHGSLGGRWYVGVVNADPLNRSDYRVQAQWLPGSGATNVNTSMATSVTQTAAALSGIVNPGGVTTAVRFDYGLTPQLGSLTAPSNQFGNFTRTIRGFLTGLSCGTLYYYRAVATNASGTSLGSTQSFTTAACPVEVIELTNGVPVVGELTLGELLTVWRYYAIDVPSDALELQVETMNRQSDLMVVVRPNSLPNYDLFACRRFPGAGLTVVSCPITQSSNPLLTPGRWYIGVSNFSELNTGVRTFGLVARVITNAPMFVNGFE